MKSKGDLTMERFSDNETHETDNSGMAEALAGLEAALKKKKEELKEEKQRYEKICKMIRERILNDHWRERFNDEEDDLEENLEDPKECREDKANTIMRDIHEKLNDDWFNNASEDEDDLEGILDLFKHIEII
ncbi:hypothetical protein Tco_1304944 [Tanacetum coccineum]